MKGDKECEEHNCEALRYCSWHPNECFGKPWAQKKKEINQKQVVSGNESRYKLDHVAFVLMLPFIIFITLLSARLYSIDNKDYASIVISVSGLALFILWLIAFVYDLMEQPE